MEGGPDEAGRDLQVSHDIREERECLLVAPLAIFKRLLRIWQEYQEAGEDDDRRLDYGGAASGRRGCIRCGNRLWDSPTFRRADRKKDHSVRLNDEVLKVWSRVIILENEKGIPRLYAEGAALSDEPRFRYACTHIERAYAEVWSHWISTQASVQEEAELIPRAKDALSQEIINAVAKEFGASVTPIESYEPNRKDVCYLTSMVPYLWQELRFFLSSSLKGAPGIEVKTQQVIQRAGPVHLINSGAFEIARVQRDADADPKRWEAMASAVIGSEAVCEQMRKVVALRRETAASLRNLAHGLTEITQQIDQGLVLRGNCELGF